MRIIRFRVSNPNCCVLQHRLSLVLVNFGLGLLQFSKKVCDALIRVSFDVYKGFDVGKNHRNQFHINVLGFGTNLGEIRRL